MARNLLQTQPVNNNNLLQQMKQVATLSDDELVSNISILLFAGYETVNKGIIFALDFLSHYPQFQQEAYEQIMRVCHDDKPITVDMISRLTCVWNIWNETLRLVPVVVGIVRSVQATFSFKGYTIPKDTLIIYNWIAAQRNKNVFGQDAEQFNPHRWSSINERQLNLNFSPFGIGTFVSNVTLKYRPSFMHWQAICQL